MEAEIQGYLTELGILRGQIRDAIKGLSDEAANWHPFPSGANSIYAILSHLIGVDEFWVKQIIAGQKIQRDRDAEFRSSGSLSELSGRWEQAWKDVEAILAKLNSSQLMESRVSPFRPERGPITVQWVVLHLISHYAIHLGHLQITRQLREKKNPAAGKPIP
jgi:uncharacterized damage-inducible protein DinB